MLSFSYSPRITKLFDLLLKDEIEVACAVGEHRDRREIPFNQLTRIQVRQILNEAEIAYPQNADHELARLALRYLIEHENHVRNLRDVAAGKTWEKLKQFMDIRGMQFLSKITTQEGDIEMTDTSIAPETVETSAAPKKAASTKKSKSSAKALKKEKAEQVGEVRASKSKFDGLKFKVAPESLTQVREGSPAHAFLVNAKSLRQPFERLKALPPRETATKKEWYDAVTLFEVSVRKGYIVQV